MLWNYSYRIFMIPGESRTSGMPWGSSNWWCIKAGDLEPIQQLITQGTLANNTVWTTGCTAWHTAAISAKMQGQERSEVLSFFFYFLNCLFFNLFLLLSNFSLGSKKSKGQIWTNWEMSRIGVHDVKFLKNQLKKNLNTEKKFFILVNVLIIVYVYEIQCDLSIYL